MTEADVIHEFKQLREAGGLVRVCWCGKWPTHHVHTGDRTGCTCDACVNSHSWWLS